jgi:two-component system, NtrC family, sensor kinase
MPRLNSLRTELLLHLAVLAAAALFIGVASIVLLYGVLDPEHAAAYMSVIIAADVFVLVGYVAYQVERVVLRPLRNAAVAAEAIAGGDVQRRIEPGETLEMENLASSFNRMTDRLLDERAHLVRVEKMASIGRLAAGVAHEIGNPLGAINGYLHILRTAAPGSAEMQDAVAGLERETARIDRIVRGMLDYARAKPRAAAEVDLNETVRTVLDLLTTQGALKHVELELLASGEPCVVVGDRHDLEQAFVNLLLNAVDAMEGQGRLQIILRQTARAELMAGGRRSNDSMAEAPRPASARAARWLQTVPGEWFAMVAIADTGPGVRIEYQERIFDPFFTTKEPGKGTGLGLAIVARAVENTGGTIWVSPSREGGAAFRMLFPLAPRQARVSGARHRPSRERAVIP